MTNEPDSANAVLLVHVIHHCGLLLPYLICTRVFLALVLSRSLHSPHILQPGTYTAFQQDILTSVMAERYISNANTELEFVKKHVASLEGAGGVSYNRDFVLSPEERERKVPSVQVSSPS